MELVHNSEQYSTYCFTGQVKSFLTNKLQVLLLFIGVVICDNAAS